MRDCIMIPAVKSSVTPRCLVSSYVRNKSNIFSTQVWDAHNVGAIAEDFHEDFSFRGSLGDTRRGHDGFQDYLDSVHEALGDYRAGHVEGGSASGYRNPRCRI